MDAGFDVRLAHTGAIPQYAGIKHGNDQTDVRHTGERLSANQIKALDNEAIADKLTDPNCLGGQLTHLAQPAAQFGCPASSTQ